MRKHFALLFALLLCLLFACAALAEDALPTATVATKSSPLTMRNMPNADGKPLGDIPKGETVTVLAFGSFPLVEYNGARGFVNGKYLMMTAPVEHLDWMDSGVYALADASSLSQEVITQLNRRIDEFEKNTKISTFVLFFSNKSDDGKKMQEATDAIVDAYLSQKQSDRRIIPTQLGGTPEGIFAVSLDVATGRMMNLCDGKPAEYLYGENGEEYWTLLDNALRDSYGTGYVRQFSAYLDALEGFCK